MHVLVTGAAGYVGQHVVAGLMDAGHTVRGLVHHAHVATGVLDDVDWVQGDVVDAKSLRRVVTDVDAIVHLAAVDLASATADPRRAIEVHVAGTQCVIDAARDEGIRVILASTAQVYGRPTVLPVAEDAPLRPVSVYGATKAAAEHLVTAQMPDAAAVLRIFNVYGAARSGPIPGNIVHAFAGRLSDGQPPEVNAHPGESRDFIHISDVARAFQLALDKNVTGTYNIGSGVETDLVQLAHASVAAWDSDVEPVLSPRPEPPMRLAADTSRAETGMGFRALVDLDEGLRMLRSGRVS